MEAAKVLLVTTEDESGDCLLLIATEEDKDEAGNGTVLSAMGEVEDEAGEYRVLVAIGDVRSKLAILDIDEVVLAFRDNEDIDTEYTESTIRDASVAASLSISISIIISLFRILLSSVDRSATLDDLRLRRGDGFR